MKKKMKSIKTETVSFKLDIADGKCLSDVYRLTMWLKDMLQSVPLEYMKSSTAHALIQANNEVVNVHIYYDREETDKEYAQRTNAAVEQAKRQKEKDLKRLKRIAAKYGINVTTEKVNK